MHAIYFYKDKQGNQPVLDYMRELARRDNKDSRIKLNKLNDYIELLSQHGTRAGQPYIKHLDAEIWELRRQQLERCESRALHQGRNPGK